MIYRLIIEVEQKEDNSAEVKVLPMEDFDKHFLNWMCACEYLLYLTASKSGASYKQAIRSLVEGSKTYRDMQQTKH